MTDKLTCLVTVNNWLSMYVTNNLCRYILCSCEWSKYFATYIRQCKSSLPEVFLGKGVLKNMQQIYRRMPMSKCDFNKVANQLYWNRTSVWVFSCKFVAYFQNTFSLEHIWRAASVNANNIFYGSLSEPLFWKLFTFFLFFSNLFSLSC